MKLSSRTFTLTALAMTGLAAYVLFAGSDKDRWIKESEAPGFQTVGENRVLNLFRRRKIPIGPSEQNLASAGEKRL